MSLVTRVVDGRCTFFLSLSFLPTRFPHACSRSRVAFDGSEEAIRFLEDPRVGQLLPDNARLEVRFFLSPARIHADPRTLQPQEPLGATDPQAILRPPADGERHYRLKTLDPNGGAFAPDSWLDSLELERQRWEFTSGLVPVLLASLSRGEGLRVDEGGVIVPGGSGVETRVSGAYDNHSLFPLRRKTLQRFADDLPSFCRHQTRDFSRRRQPKRRSLASKRSSQLSSSRRTRSMRVQERWKRTILSVARL